MMIRNIFNKLALSLFKGSISPYATRLKTCGIPLQPAFYFCTGKKKDWSHLNSQDEIDSNDNSTNIDLNYLEIVSQYPFYSIPVNVIRNPSNYKLQEQELKTLVALKCLQAKPNDLRLGYSLLFPDNTNYKDLQYTDNQGRIMFTEYMGHHLPEWIQTINKQKGHLNERIACMMFWSYLQFNSDQEEQINRLDELSIIKQDPSGVMLGYYVSLLAKYRKDYTHLLELLMKKLNQTSIDISARLNICKSIVRTFKFEQKYPQKIIATVFQILTESLPKMANYQLIYFIRCLYPHRSKEAKVFAQNLKQFLMKKQSGGEIDFHVPLVLKVIKFCNKQGVQTENLVEFIVKNMKRFQVIFNRQNISKGLFFQLIFQRYRTKDLSQQILSYLKNYFKANITKFAKAEQIEQDEMIRTSKLLLKYMNFFSTEQRQEIKLQYINQILPFYQNQDEILFYNILIYLRETDEKQTDQPKKSHDKIVKYIDLYITKRCVRNEEGQLQVQSHINSVIELMYQVIRHDIPLKKQSLPFICKYNFDTKDTISSEAVGNFFFYLKKNQHEKKSDIRRVLSEIQPLLQIFLRKKRINSIKTIFIIIDVCSFFQFQHQFFYKIVQNSIAGYLAQSPNYVIIRKDIEFLLEKFIKRGYGSRALRTMLASTLKQPNDWQKFKAVYVENQKKFQQMQRVNRQNRRNQSR